jgi:dienelactone hydrolase
MALSAVECGEDIWSLGLGPHEVGVSLVHEKNLEIMVWYPAEASENAPGMVLRAYFFPERWDGLELEEEERAARIERFMAQPIEFGADRARLEKILALPVGARPNAAPKKGSFPLVIYLPGVDARAHSNFRLCEFLAGHGFIVASTHHREQQAADNAQVLSIMKEYPRVAGDTISLVGHSAGGVSNVAMTMDDNRIDALVCLDGSIVGKDVMAGMRKDANFDPGRVKIPVLLTLSRWWRTAAGNHQNFDNGFYEGVTGEAWLLDFRHMDHTDFVAEDHLRFGHTGIDYQEKFGIDVDVQAATRGYAATCRYVLAFLQAVLRDDPKARAWLEDDPGAHGISMDQMLLEHRPARCGSSASPTPTTP